MVTNVGGYQITASGTAMPPESSFNELIQFGNKATAGLSFSGEGILMSGGVPVVAGATLSGPLEFRFTTATISCLSSSSCRGFVSLDALVFGVTIGGEGATLPVTVGLDGTTGKGLPLVTWNAGINTVSDSLAGGGGNVSLTPTFAYIVSAGAASVFSNISMALDFTITQLGAGQSINLPSSLWLSVGDAQANQVPEPGTILLLGAGLAGFYWFRKR